MKTEKELQQRREAQKRYVDRNHEKVLEKQRASYRKNREARNRWRRDYQRKRVEQFSAYHLLRRYKLTQEEWKAKLLAQNNKCAICGIEMDKPCLDHDHETDKNRDFLCRFCNLVLGNARDCVQVLLNAVEYLRRHGVENDRQETSPI